MEGFNGLRSTDPVVLVVRAIVFVFKLISELLLQVVLGVIDLGLETFRIVHNHWFWRLEGTLVYGILFNLPHLLQPRLGQCIALWHLVGMDRVR